MDKKINPKDSAIYRTRSINREYTEKRRLDKKPTTQEIEKT